MWTASRATGLLLTVFCVFIAADVSASISFAPAILGCSSKVCQVSRFQHELVCVKKFSSPVHLSMQDNPTLHGIGTKSVHGAMRMKDSLGLYFNEWPVLFSAAVRPCSFFLPCQQALLIYILHTSGSIIMPIYQTSTFRSLPKDQLC